MARIPVIVELAADQSNVAAAAFGDVEMESFAAAAAPALPGLDLDPGFAPVPIPQLVELATFAASLGMESESAQDSGEVTTIATSFIVRGEIEEDEVEALAAREGVVGVFSDPTMTPMQICPGSPPLGSDADVERLLCTSRLRAVQADGRSVLVAIVDTGVNIAYLNAHGKHPVFDAARSWVPQAGVTPGSMPVDHGTMCAFDACIAAPACTIIDIPFLAAGGRLTDAIRAYNHLVALMRAPRRPGESRSLVVNNSWGMPPTAFDFPVGDPRNYSRNPNHPFNVIVGTLEGLGADILFAAGNCGGPCPSGNCGGITANTIIGANGHPKVLSVAGVDTTKQRVGYSSQGPGLLTRNKPDLCGYTHFRGSGVFAADGGTSAATPVVAGLVAAYRSKRPFQPGNPSVSPEAVRNLFRASCEDLGTAGFDFDHGFGVIRGCQIADGLEVREPELNLCAIVPRLCGTIRMPVDLCERFPQLCTPRTPIELPPIRLPGLPGRLAASQTMVDLGAQGEALATLSRNQLVELVYTLGYHDGSEGAAAAPAPPAPAAGPAKCGCGGG